MKSTIAFERAQEIAADFDYAGQPWVGNLRNEHWSWSLSVLGHIVSLLGGEEIEYATGYATSDDGIAGQFAVFTKSIVIFGSFAKSHGYGHQTDTHAAARSIASITQIDSVVVGTFVDHPDAVWPDRLKATLHFTDGTELGLPLSERTWFGPEATDKLARFLPTLARMIGAHK